MEKSQKNIYRFGFEEIKKLLNIPDDERIVLFLQDYREDKVKVETEKIKKK